MTTKSTIPQELQDIIKKGMIRGYKDDDGKRIYPTLKKSARYYKISYDALRQIAPEWKWREKREKWKAKLHRKYLEKKETEELCEAEAEELVINDIEYNNTASKTRKAIDMELDKITEGKVYLYSTKEGEAVYGTPKNTAYLLMNLAKGLVDAQKTAKLAAGEPSEIQKLQGFINTNEALLYDPDYIQRKRMMMDDYYEFKRKKS